jgi:hypothetical protein
MRTGLAQKTPNGAFRLIKRSDAFWMTNQKLLPFGLLFDRVLLVISKTQLLATYHLVLVCNKALFSRQLDWFSRFSLFLLLSFRNFRA